MIIKANNKEYFYDYKYLYIHGKEHEKLMKLAKEHKVPASRMLVKLIKHYEDTKTEEIKP
jgi:hypothetical protein